MSDLNAGDVVDGRYRVISRLGSGGMADVYLAEDQQLGRHVALKLLHRRFSADPGFVERFRREAQAAAGLQHPNVVSVYDRGAFDGTYYIAMEYLPGRSLKQLIRQEAPLDPVRAIDITVQILKAARFAHRRGVIHRDLKPHNVIIDDTDHAKVTDFGIARAGASDMTETGSIMGTAQYLSPEQAQGHAVSETSDLYSVGIVLYEMLTGRVPFDGESAVTIALKHVSEAPPPPRAINPAIPPDLEQVVLWVLNKNPADRPADADQFVAVLEQVRESIVSGTRGQVTASMAAVSPGSPPGVVPTVLMPSGAPVTGAYALSEPPPLEFGERTNGGSSDDTQSRSRADNGEGRIWPWLLGLFLVLLLAGGAVAVYLLTRPPQRLVPEVVNETQGVASTTVSNYGFTPNVIYQTSSSPDLTVIAQSPTGGTKANKGSTITLTVSNGPGSVDVPSVIQLAEPGARRAIDRAGLKVAQILPQSSQTVAQGFATGTSPAAGTSLQVGHGVILYISSGKPPVKVPDVTGDTAAAAKNSLSAAGFTVATSNQPVTSNNSSQIGTVLSQSPTAGSQAPNGSSVAIVLGTAPTTVSVPDVVGDTAAAADSTLTGAGFTVTKQIKVVDQPNEDGNVVSQSPAANGNAKKGSAVTIVIGKYKSHSTTTPTHTTTTPTTTTTTPTTTSTTPTTTSTTPAL
jgi:eukaryotic-like serine/threonine-protein kinase